QWNEPFGIVMAEAMACGTPVIGFPFGSVPEVVEDGVTGFQCNNTDEIAQKVQEITRIDRRTVRKVAEQRFSDKAIVSHYLALYEKHRQAVVLASSPHSAF
ncbi:MAG: glycosyltransferase, partial [Chitinophagaceae bacterium]